MPTPCSFIVTYFNNIYLIHVFTINQNWQILLICEKQYLKKIIQFLLKISIFHIIPYLKVIQFKIIFITYQQYIIIIHFYHTQAMSNNTETNLPGQIENEVPDQQTANSIDTNYIDSRHSGRGLLYWPYNLVFSLTTFSLVQSFISYNSKLLAYPVSWLFTFGSSASVNYDDPIQSVLHLTRFKNMKDELL